MADSNPGSGPFVDEILPGDVELSEVTFIDSEFSFEEGFSRLDWNRAWELVKSGFPEERYVEAWREVRKRWLLQLKHNLGGSYRIYESDHFYLLSAETRGPAKKLLGYAEESLASINETFGPPDARNVSAKMVILAFSEEDDYYSYIAYFYKEGEYSLTSGVFISQGCPHIAFPLRTIYQAREVIIHELVHHCLFGLAIPVWLEEGIAQRMEKILLNQPFLVDRELGERHREFWNEENIQGFWSGASFHIPGDSNELSYSLAEILVFLLSERGESFKRFIEYADYRDGGQTAALDILDCCLGKTLEGLLGEGQWRPQRKAIADYLEEIRK